MQKLMAGRFEKGEIVVYPLSTMKVLHPLYDSISVFLGKNLDDYFWTHRSRMKFKNDIMWLLVLVVI